MDFTHSTVLPSDMKLRYMNSDLALVNDDRSVRGYECAPIFLVVHTFVK